ncbi:MAG: LuxR C-terminal-related transcriptional regulator [Thermomicrobiales bacterium]
MLERDAALAEMRHCLRQADAGHGLVLLVCGEAGMGKTSLLNRFLAGTAARVLLGRCDGVATPRPLAPIFDLNEPTLTSLLLEQAPRDLLFRAVLERLASRHATSILAIEDAHWADEATIDLLHYLGRRIAERRTLLVLTFRDDDVGARHPLRRLLGDLATGGALHRVDLEPLSLGAVQVLARGSRLDPAKLHAHTGGNPFFVTEVLAAPGAVPPRVSDAVLARASRLPPSAWDVLAAAAVIGSPVDPHVLQEVAAPAPGDLDACLEHGLLVQGARELSFRHELARQAMEGALSQVRRRAVHRRVLRALEARPTASEPGRLAHHAAEAGEAEAVLRYAPLAAQRAVRLRAYCEAAQHYERALRFADTVTPVTRATLLAAHAEASYHTAHIDAALASSQKAIAIWQATGSTRELGVARAHLAGILWAEGKIGAALQEIQRAVSLLETHAAGPDLAAAYGAWARLAGSELASVEATRLATRALALAMACGADATRLDAEMTLGEAELVQGSLAAGEVRLKVAIAEAVAAGLTEVAVRGYLCLGQGLGLHGRPSQALAHARAGLRFAREHDLRLAERHLETQMAQCQLRRGDWDAALRVATGVLAAQEAAPASRFVAQIVAGLVLVRRGQAHGLALLEEARALATASGSLVYMAPWLAAQAEAAVLLHQPTAPWAAALSQVLATAQGPFASSLAYWGRVCGVPDPACPDQASPYCLQTTGRWEEASAAWTAQGAPYEAARASAEGHDEAALRKALATCEALEARPLAAHLRRRLRGLGAQRISRGPQSATRRNPAGLTRREREVLDVLMGGVTSPEIARRLHLSARTVENHIAAICAKLGVSNRADAIAAARRLGLTAENT